MTLTANAAPDKTTDTTKPQRDAKGRFLPGNDGGPGNPFGRHLARARVEWNSKATPEHVENVYNVVYKKACEGCAWAVKLYLLYLLGKPKEMVNPDLADIDEWELYAKATNMQKASPDVMNSPDHRFGLEVARTMRPAMAEEARKEMLEGLKEMEENEREMTRVEDEYERRAEKRRAKRKAQRAKRKASGKRGASAKREASGRTQEPARTDSRPSSFAPRPSLAPLPDGFFERDLPAKQEVPPLQTDFFGPEIAAANMLPPSLNGEFAESDESPDDDGPRKR